MSTQAYVDLMFAWGHARLGDVETARTLMGRARALLRHLDDRVHVWLVTAFEYRVEQAMANRPHGGSFPTKLRESLDGIDEDRRGASRRYVVDRMRQVSRILEPDGGVNPYEPWAPHGTSLQRRIAETLGKPPTASATGRLTTLPQEVESTTDPLERCWSYRSMFGQCGLGTAHQAGGELISVSRQFSVHVLRERWASHPDVPTLFARHLPPPGSFAEHWEGEMYRAASADPGKWVEQAVYTSATNLFVAAINQAAQIGRRDLLSDCFQDALRLMQGSCAVQPWGLILPLSKGFIRLGMEPEARVLSDRFADGRLAAYHASGNPDHLATSLSLAAADLWLGRVDKGIGVLETARGELARLPHSAPIVRVACEYLQALSQAQWRLARDHLRALLAQLPPARNSYTTAPWYSRFHLELVEQFVLVVAANHSGAPADIFRSMSDAEIASRREALVEVRGRLVEWGQKDWDPVKSP